MSITQHGAPHGGVGISPLRRHKPSRPSQAGAVASFRLKNLSKPGGGRVGAAAAEAAGGASGGVAASGAASGAAASGAASALAAQASSSPRAGAPWSEAGEPAA